MKITSRIMLLTLIAGLVLMLVNISADARRMGGGQNLGRQVPTQSYRSSSPSVVSPSLPSQSSHTVIVQPARSGASRWLGPLAGLAVGGLLGAMFFGGAFSGIHLLDVIVIIALVAGVWLLIRAFRSRAPVEQPSPVEWSPAGGKGVLPMSGPVDEIDFGAPRFGGGRVVEDPRLSSFNQEEFLAAARRYFVQLQAAWDANRMSEIQEFTTPDLFHSLVEERSKIGQEKNVTEVVELEADMQSLGIEDNQIVASVLFSGYIRENVWEAPKQFSEIWNIQRSVNPPSSTWFIAGIQQT